MCILLLTKLLKTMLGGTIVKVCRVFLTILVCSKYCFFFLATLSSISIMPIMPLRAFCIKVLITVSLIGLMMMIFKLLRDYKYI